jgi:CheY-like chemotaxis protein
VEDEENDALLIRRAFERAGINDSLQRVCNGLEALAYLSGDPPFQDRNRYPLPFVVMLDIKLPLMDGFEVLKWIRKQPAFLSLCVVMLTSSDDMRMVNRAYRLGANSFFVKPLDFWNAGELIRSLQRVLAK